MNSADIFWALPLGICIAIGALAQRWKDRIGAGWGAMTLLVIGAMWVFFIVFVPSVHTGPALVLAQVILASLLGGGFMLLLIATLPRRQK